MPTSLEYILTNTRKKEMISWLKSNPGSFEEAILLAVSDKQPWSWRAAWLLWSCMEDNDRRIRKYLDRIIDFLPSAPINQQRELLIILWRMEIPGESEAILLEFCKETWENKALQPSVRLNAFRLLVKIAGRHAELQREIRILAESQYTDTLSENVKKAVGKLINFSRE